MVVIEVQLLTGRYVAIANNQKATSDAYAEWPPHPARFFSALVAALHDLNPCDPAERDVLVRLAQQPPEIEASNVTGEFQIQRRSVARVYVPANDMDAIAPLSKLEKDMIKMQKEFEKKSINRGRRGKAISASKTSRTNSKNFATELLSEFDNRTSHLSEWRASLFQRPANRSERTFPSVTPDKDIIRFGWPAVDLNETECSALAHLVQRVTRFGHSSSLVRCSLTDRIEPTLRPQERTDTAQSPLRVPYEDQLDRLERAFKIHQAITDRVLPSRPQGYSVVTAEAGGAPDQPCSLFSDCDWIVLAVEKNTVQLTRCVDVAKALHGALVKQAPDSRFISGRDSNGKAATDPHLALVPLPDAGHEHAQGGVLGIALIMPRGTSPEDKQKVREALVDWELAQPDNGDEPPMLPLLLPGGLMIQIRRHETPNIAGLRTRTWCRSSCRWVSVTPLALDRNPGKLSARTPEIAYRAADIARGFIRDACVRIGLPFPLKVDFSFAPLLPGSAPVRAFDPFPREPNRLRRVRLHVELTFERPVRGPVLLGAGRFFGLGLFRPIG